MAPRKKSPEQKAKDRLAESVAERRIAKARLDAAEGTERALVAEERFLAAQEAILETQLEIAVLRGNTDDIKKYAAALEALRVIQDELTEATKEAAEAQKKLDASMHAGAGAAGKLAGSIGIVNKGLSKFSMDAEGAEKALDGFIDEMGELLSKGNLVANFLGTIWDETLKQITSIDEATTDLKKTFGVTFGTELAGNLTAIQGEMRTLGFSASDTEQSFVALGTGVSDFKSMSDDARISLSANTTLLTRFGISAADSAEGYEYLTEVLGQTQEDAEENLRRFVDLGDEIGKQPGIIASEFASMQGTFARYGDEAVKTFMKTQVAAKRLGLETSELIAISEGFDTFETAGESVGTLNALLGGPFLNSIEMIQKTDPVERLEMIREALFMSGRSFAEMAEREQMALAEHIPGINGDVALLGRIMSDMNSDIAIASEDMATLTGETASGFDEMTGKAKKAMTISELFAAIKADFALDPEAIDMIVDTVKFFLFLVNGLGKAFKYVTGDLLKLYVHSKPIFDFMKMLFEGASASKLGKSIGDLFTKMAVGIKGFFTKIFTWIGGFFTSSTGKKVVIDAGGEIAEGFFKRMGLKAGGFFGKTIGKAAGPVGLVLGVSLGIMRFLEGDILGGILEIISGIAGMLGPIGMLVSVVISFILLGKDLLGSWTRVFKVIGGMFGGAFAAGLPTAGLAAPIGAIAGGVAAYKATAPALANGGVVPATPRPYILGDGGQREVVQPLDEFKKSNAGASNIHVTVGFDYDGRGLKAFVKDTIYSDIIT